MTNDVRQCGAALSLRDAAQAVGGRATADATFTSITSDSRQVRPGDLFVAQPGEHVHGIRFASQAREAGAVAILTDEEGARICDIDVALLVVENPGAVAGAIASMLMGYPASDMQTFAVTGTNGKTTTVYMIDSIMEALGKQSGIIGTVEIRLAQLRISSHLTTPMPDELQSYLALHRDQGGDSLAMEVSSHALVQGRTDPVIFDVAGFTNLTQDHLDFHCDMEEYFEAKAGLFTRVRARAAVVNVDDKWGRVLLERAAENLDTVVALAVESELGELPASVTGWKAVRSGQGFELRSTSGHVIQTSTTLPGNFNIANAALAILMVLVAGYDIEEVSEVVRSGINPKVPGRMEMISTHPRVIVDFAHNTEALVHALDALRPTTRGKLIVLTGAAGQRDKSKRPAMGEAVSRLADLVYITDDDPHGEDPSLIRADVLSGTKAWDTPVREIPNRAEAIATSIAQADDEDTILLAGRGHETIQDVAGVLIELDDRVEARRALKARGSSVEEQR